MTKQSRHSLFWCISSTVAVAVSVAVAGCDSGRPATYPVEGKVVFPDGTPLTGGMVEFEFVGGEGNPLNARGRIEEDGTFCLSTFEAGDGALAGEHRAIVRPPAPDYSPRKSGPLPKRIIDPRFERYGTSDLRFTVKEGKNDFITIQVARPGS